MSLKKIRRTKIVITLGPSTDENDNLEKAILAGASILRLNFSHGTQAEHERRAYHAFKIIKKIGCHVALLGDLQGPKIRITSFKKKYVFLVPGKIFVLNANLKVDAGDEKQVGIDYKKLYKDLKVSDILLLDDGRIQLEVIDIYQKKIFTKVLIGGKLSNNKGVNKLGGGLSADSLTEKDKNDILIASNIGVDYLSVSFPSHPRDLMLARELSSAVGNNPKIIAKIERAEVVSNIDTMKRMILASDAIMVARGDLGVEIGDSELIGVQKTLIKYARQLNRIVITATQMMESMVYNPIPTRAEVMDVANAVLDGTDAVMLSSETATGKYPSETVQAMSNICLGAEKIPSMHVSKHRIGMKFDNIEETITMSAMYSANHLYGVSAIITLTESGLSALLTSRISSGLPIFALSKYQSVLNLVSLYRGVVPIYFNSPYKDLQVANDAILLLLKKNLLRNGDIIIITQGDIMGQSGKTNIHRILQV
ncbi:pyruvate kinase [Buchnera aphidicola]|uniref:Pyruvate kinase n=1 Tax=Buchnera aphidicola (Sarucallis kahawaluokalani) TaxID=1241878 RepID=A0A4D6YJ51_9GAMM|nr:pyruvate kinase [Buchnera aphidicola]QCI26014.1 pyruvate kinase [Buchnera aphidicola (Sarucallis kahawaluokalani)]